MAGKSAHIYVMQQNIQNIQILEFSQIFLEETKPLSGKTPDKNSPNRKVFNPLYITTK